MTRAPLVPNSLSVDVVGTLSRVRGQPSLCFNRKPRPMVGVRSPCHFPESICADRLGLRGMGTGCAAVEPTAPVIVFPLAGGRLSHIGFTSEVAQSISTSDRDPSSPSHNVLRLSNFTPHEDDINYTAPPLLTHKLPPVSSGKLRPTARVAYSLALSFGKDGFFAGGSQTEVQLQDHQRRDMAGSESERALWRQRAEDGLHGVRR